MYRYDAYDKEMLTDRSNTEFPPSGRPPPGRRDH